MFASGDPETALANSVIYLEAFGHLVVAWLWLEQELAAAGRDGDFYDGKRAAARYFFGYELPRTRPQLDLRYGMSADLDDPDELLQAKALSGGQAAGELVLGTGTAAFTATATGTRRADSP